MTNRTARTRVAWGAVVLALGCESSELEKSDDAARATAQGLTNSASWQGAWSIVEGSATAELRCDRIVQGATEQEPGEPITIVAGTGETFKLVLAPNCELPFTVSGSVATYQGSVRCTEPGPDGLIFEATYRSGRLSLEPNTRLSGTVSADIAFGSIPCTLSQSVSYERPPAPPI